MQIHGYEMQKQHEKKQDQLLLLVLLFNFLENDIIDTMVT